MGALTLVQGTRAGGGKATAPQLRQKGIAALDRFEGAASVKLVAAGFVDYLHLAKFNGKWVKIGRAHV